MDSAMALQRSCNMVFTQGHGFVLGTSFGLPRSFAPLTAYWFATPWTPPLWQRGNPLVNCFVLRRFLTSERSGVVKTFRYVTQVFPNGQPIRSSSYTGDSKTQPVVSPSCWLGVCRRFRTGWLRPFPQRHRMLTLSLRELRLERPRLERRQRCFAQCDLTTHGYDCIGR